MRAELGYSGANVDDVIEEWKENRRKLGLPETPDSASMAAAAPGPGDEDDDPDDKKKNDDANKEDDDDDG